LFQIQRCLRQITALYSGAVFTFLQKIYNKFRTLVHDQILISQLSKWLFSVRESPLLNLIDHVKSQSHFNFNEPWPGFEETFCGVIRAAAPSRRHIIKYSRQTSKFWLPISNKPSCPNDTYTWEVCQFGFLCKRLLLWRFVLLKWNFLFSFQQWMTNYTELYKKHEIRIHFKIIIPKIALRPVQLHGGQRITLTYRTLASKTLMY
jgi:hypothetical protein